MIRLLLCAVVANAAIAADWPQWRGPNRDAICTETGLLKTWPADGPALAWKATGLGEGYSTVAVVGDRLFTMGDIGDAQVLCLDAKDGAPVWKAKVGKPGGNYPGTRCTPTVDKGQVFALGQFGDLVCLDAASGKELWRKNLASDLGGKPGGWNYTESLLVDGDQVICTPGGGKGAVAALNRATGAVKWQTGAFTEGAQYVSPIVAEIGGVRQYVQMTMGAVIGIGTDGAILWRVPRKGATAVIPTPVHKDGMILVASGYGVGCNMFKVTGSGRAFSATQVYANTDLVNHHGGLVLLGDHVYGHSDKKGLVCMELATGKVAWSSGNVGKGAVLCADGLLYCRNEGGKGTMVLVEAKPDAFSEKGRFDQPDRSKANAWAHPVLANGRLYLRDQDVLLCYDVKGK